RIEFSDTAPPDLWTLSGLPTPPYFRAGPSTEIVSSGFLRDGSTPSLLKGSGGLSSRAFTSAWSLSSLSLYAYGIPSQINLPSCWYSCPSGSCTTIFCLPVIAAEMIEINEPSAPSINSTNRSSCPNQQSPSSADSALHRARLRHSKSTLRSG